MICDIAPNMIDAKASVLDAIKVIDAGKIQIVLVHEDGRLVGTVTDGDVRRGILGGIQLSSLVSEIMNRHPVTVPASATVEEAIALMRTHSIHQLPIVDETGCVVGIRLLDNLLLKRDGEDNWVVLMAGGLGTRLRPLTDDCPKPLLKVGERPIMETILQSFIDQGYRKFFISVNYMAEMIEAYFGDGSRWGAEIVYLRETERMGTAGALSLLPARPEQPFFVMNGDLLTKANFRQMLNFHREHSATATMSVREYSFTVPYGVVQTDDQYLVEIQEKPVHKFFVNAGIYILEPEALDHIQTSAPLDMPALFEMLMKQGRQASVFPLREYWIDIGQHPDLERATVEYGENFTKA